MRKDDRGIFAGDEEYDSIQARYHDRAPLDPSYNELSRSVIGAAMAVHSALGPGRLEAFYQRAMNVELAYQRIPYRQQVPMSVSYRDTHIGDSVLDLLVDNRLVVELKSVESIAIAHRMQLSTYLKAGDYQLGLIINFNVPRLRSGIARIINTPLL